MTWTRHAARIGLLMILAAALLGWLARHTEVLFADGLRYIEQARQIDRGDLAGGLVRAVDHPAYPLAIVAVRHALGAGDGPDGWQASAQVASALAGVLLIVPLYLVSLEVYGPRSAWLGCLLAFAVPLTGHVLADALSEGIFLLFWTWGLWSALRFLRVGSFAWLPLTIGFTVLAYLSRPEGLLLPAALVATLALMPMLRSTRLNWPRWWAAVGVLVLGPPLVAGPYMALKGGLGTKPAIQRLLGTAPRSAADAVERQRPLDPDQSTSKTYGVATKAMFEAVRDSVTPPMLALALVGLAFAWPPRDRERAWLFLILIVAASTLALVRLHATGGYCSPRHALVPALLILLAAGHGLHRLLGLAIPGRWLGLGEGRVSAGPAVWALALAGVGAWYAPTTVSPVNPGFAGYRAAGVWLRDEPYAPGARVIDVTGWTLYYGQRQGYTFANLAAAEADPWARWVVAREAHLTGPWGYCRQLRALVDGLKPKRVFPEDPRPGQSRVFLYDLASRPGWAIQAAARVERR